MRNSTLIAEAYKEAAKDIKFEIQKLRKAKPNDLWVNWDTYENGCDVWNVSLTDLYSSESRKLNAELGLNTLAGTNEWYNK